MHSPALGIDEADRLAIRTAGGVAGADAEVSQASLESRPRTMSPSLKAIGCSNGAYLHERGSRMSYQRLDWVVGRKRCPSISSSDLDHPVGSQRHERQIVAAFQWEVSFLRGVRSPASWAAQSHEWSSNDLPAATFRQTTDASWPSGTPRSRRPRGRVQSWP